METSPDTARELALLENIERDPDVTQASLATQLGVAVPERQPLHLWCWHMGIDGHCTRMTMCF